MKPNPYELVWARSFSRDGLWLLAALLQVPAPVGLEGPAVSSTPEDAEAQVTQSLQMLVEQAMLEVNSEGDLALEADLVALIEAATLAEQTLVVSCTDSDHTSRLRYAHLTTELIVEQETLPDGQVTLTAVRDAETLTQRLAEFIGLAEAPTAPGPAVELSQADLAAARELAGVGDVAACRAHLRYTGIPAAVAVALAETLVGGHAISAVLLRREATETHVGESLAWLAGRAGVWNALPAVGESGQVRIRLAPATTAEVHDQIKRVFLHEEHERREG